MLLWYANISIAVARPWRNSQIRPVNVPFEESGSPCSAAEKGFNDKREDRIYKRIMTMKITVAEEPAIASEQ